MIETIEKLKRQMDEARQKDGDWKTPYYELMKTLYDQEVLFFALSRSEYDPETRTSTPLISTKDFGGVPALYVFSDADIASIWMSHYKHVSEDMKYGLIGAIRKDQFGFLSVFQIAGSLGAQMIMLDEGGDYIGMDISVFLDAVGVDPEKIEIPLNQEELDKMLENRESPAVRFVPVPAIPLKNG